MMVNPRKNKQTIKISILVASILITFFSFSYAFINQTLHGTKLQVINSGTLRLELKEENEIKLENALPMYDEVGMIQEPFIFSLTNAGYEVVNYVVRLVSIDTENTLDSYYIRYGLIKDNKRIIDSLSNLTDNEIDSGSISKNQTISYELRFWIDSNVEDETLINGKTFSYRLEIEMKQKQDKYVESILNGTEPVLSDNLVPVTIENDGTVRKADIKDKWYSYEKKEWANAVVLDNKNQDYKPNDIIPEDNIQSYFVWIPKYSYQLWDLGDYEGTTEIDETKVHTIPVKFGLEDTNDANDGECTTPGVSGETGNCKVGDYMTHPAFQAFNSTGFWVGKFESGYKDAKTTEEAQVNESDSTRLIIKPDVYSWRGIPLGNMFKVSYDYLREDESHMMKNTEWGAVAYLQHSAYGSHTDVRVNNNSSYKTGYSAVEEPTLGRVPDDISTSGNMFGIDSSITLPYNTLAGYMASTTGNISGIYDMSGGASEIVSAHNGVSNLENDKSDITTVYPGFFTNDDWKRYYDQYFNDSLTNFNYKVRILGDAVGEVGPFQSYPATISGGIWHYSSWYKDFGLNLHPNSSWLSRGSSHYWGTQSGIFAFSNSNGGSGVNGSFRVVLTPHQTK